MNGLALKQAGVDIPGWRYSGKSPRGDLDGNSKATSCL
jgi:hypothetical protein